MRPGQEVLVPWELTEAHGTVVEIRGVGPAAVAKVRVQIPDDGQEELEFPLGVLSSVRR